MNILIFTHPKVDYLANATWSGLYHLVGKNHLYMIEYKPSYTGVPFYFPCTDTNNQTKDLLRWDHLSYVDKVHTNGIFEIDFIQPGQEYLSVKYRTKKEIQNLIALNFFDLYIVESERLFALQSCRYFINKFGRKHISPLISFDPTDSIDYIHTERSLTKVRPDILFIREISSLKFLENLSLSSKICHCPMSSLSIKKSIDYCGKDIDILLPFTVYSAKISAQYPYLQFRLEILKELENLRSKYKIVQYNTVDPSEYLDYIKRSRIVIDVPGGSFTTTLRQFEVPIYNTLLFRMIPQGYLPNDWTHKQNVVNYKQDLSDLKELLIEYLKKDLTGISKRCSNHMYKHHTSIKRMEYVLDEVRKLKEK